MPIIKHFKNVQGNSWGKFYTATSGHMAEKKHYKKSDFVLVESLVLFYGQVNKALISISHWLVSLLVFFIRYAPAKCF